MVNTPVFLDHHATTPLDPRVLDVLVRTTRDVFGNPASTGHAFGWAAAEVVAQARTRVAELIGAAPEEIIFTGGATEADNMALLGTAITHGADRNHLVVSNLEHDAVSGPALELERRGCRLTRVSCGPSGIIAPDDVAGALTPHTWLVSVMAAQNEIGTVQPLGEIGAVCRAAGVLFHTDAAQAVGRIPLDVQNQNIDLLSLSAHKLYGPKGVGVLYVRRRNPRVRLAPLMFGGGQERGLRPGTLNVPAIAACGEACRLAGLEMETEATRVGELRDRLLAKLRGGLTGVVLNGAVGPRLPGNLNVSFTGLPTGGLLPRLTTLAVSAGSACQSAEAGPSRLLTALGVGGDLARSSLRIGVGRFNTAAEIDFAAAVIIAAVQELRTRCSR